MFIFFESVADAGNLFGKKTAAVTPFVSVLSDINYASLWQYIFNDSLRCISNAVIQSTSTHALSQYSIWTVCYIAYQPKTLQLPTGKYFRENSGDKHIRNAANGW
mgnify:CR=1 FL=1